MYIIWKESWSLFRSTECSLQSDLMVFHTDTMNALLVGSSAAHQRIDVPEELHSYEQTAPVSRLHTLISRQTPGRLTCLFSFLLCCSFTLSMNILNISLRFVPSHCLPPFITLSSITNFLWLCCLLPVEIHYNWEQNVVSFRLVISSLGL